MKLPNSRANKRQEGKATLTPEQIEHEMRKAAFEQNHASFRSLNQQMWQIPLISMTLTGGLWFTTWTNREKVFGVVPDDPALSYYETYAASLADGYETLSLESAHPTLLALIEDSFGDRPLSVLDVGAGTGRDASWFAAHGHRIVAVEPSPAMQRIGKRLHPAPEIEWRSDSLPNLVETQASGEKYDLIVLSAVWMHVKPNDRQHALKTLLSLLKSGGKIYLTLRIGPSEPARGIYRVSVDELQELLTPLGVQTEKLDEQTDLLGRSNIRWIAMSISLS